MRSTHGRTITGFAQPTELLLGEFNRERSVEVSAWGGPHTSARVVPLLALAALRKRG